ncbi:MAG: CHAT domain-containing protein [bacterium]
MPSPPELSSQQLQQYLRLLVIIAAPVCGKEEYEPPSQPLDVWGEWRRFAQAFEHSRDRVQGRAAPYAVVRLFPPTLENLRHALAFGDANSAYQIVHFIGHGNTEGLALEDEWGREQFVPLAELIAAFKNSRAKLVVLNACETRALAQALQHAGIPAVIGTHAPIADEAAKVFSETFYSRLALGQSLQTAFTAAQEILAEKSGLAAAQNLSLLQLTDKTLPLPLQPATDFQLLANEPPHNLPLSQYTRHFAGRGPELVQIGQWMAELAEPVIALHGVGGIGKSSLATMAALRYCHRFEAVIFATAKDDPQNFGVEKIVQALDAVCGTSCLGEPTPEKRQQAALRVLNSRRLLLVLDNLETLSAEATAALGNFLRQLDHRLGSLALLTLRPRQKDPLTALAGNCNLPVAALDLFSACQLVHDLAGEKLLPKFAPRPPAAPEKPLLQWLAPHLGYSEAALPLLAAVYDLAVACHRHPKLVELALGDLRRPTTSFAAVIQRLQKLPGKDLQAAVDDMLGRMLTALQAEAPGAVALLQTMTIFRGAAEVSALAAVHAGEEPDAFKEVLDAAVDSSLLSAENDRVWLHSLTAQFLEKHAPLPEASAQAYRRRHAEYYLEKARQYEDENMEQWRGFDVDWENIAAAADWVAALPVEQEEQAKLVGDFALAVKDVVYWRKLPAEKWLLAGAAAFARLENKMHESLMYNSIGLIDDARGDYDAALQWYQKSVAIDETLGDRAGLATSYNNIGLIYKARGDYDAALQWYQKSVAILVVRFSITVATFRHCERSEAISL